MAMVIYRFSKVFRNKSMKANLNCDNHHQAGTVIAFYNGVRVEASENRYPDEYRVME